MVRAFLAAGMVSLLVFGTGALSRMSDRRNNVYGRDPEPTSRTVWTSERPTGKVWEKLGSGGFIRIGTPNRSGGATLAIHMEAEGTRLCGLNWKGWYPVDACDDATPFNSLAIRIRQITNAPNADLVVSLTDNTKAEGKASNSFSLLQQGGIRYITSEWQTIVLPLAEFARDRPLKLDKLWGIDFENSQKGIIEFEIDSIAFTSELPPMLKFETDGKRIEGSARLLTHDGWAIPETIYGLCGASAEKLREYDLPLTRWGGNTSSKYNWKINADSGAKDWFFKNRGTPVAEPSENNWHRLIRDNKSIGASAYLTVPTLGWVARDNRSASYSVHRYGVQKATEPGNADIGNGIDASGLHVRNNPEDASIQVGPDFVAEGVRHVVKNVGRASDGGVRYWVLDNEPMLWHDTHRDVHPHPASYDELWTKTVEYAEAIRKEDPTAKIAGFCSWGWTDLFASAADEAGNNYRTRPDCNRHNGMPLGEWFIMKCGEYKAKRGKPLVDVFDFHWYPQELNGRKPYEDKGMNLSLNEYRLRSTRELWDASYTSESWIRGAGDGKPAQVIRRIQQWIARHNPGMEVALGEYNFGGTDNITGAIAQAETFGILAREKVALGFLWQSPEGTQAPVWQLFRNYDGRGGRFGEHYLPTICDRRELTVHMARRRSDNALTAAVINRSLSSAADFTLTLPGDHNVQAWRIDQEHGNRVAETPDIPRTQKGILKLKLPAGSVTMLVLKE